MHLQTTVCAPDPAPRAGGWCKSNGEEMPQTLISTLVDCYFFHPLYQECWCIGCVLPSSTVTSRAGFYWSPCWGWYYVLLTRYLISPFTMAKHTVKVYVMGACRRHVSTCVDSRACDGSMSQWRARGRRANDFDEHQDNEANKALEAQNHNNQGITTPSHAHVFVDNNFLNFCWFGCK